MSGRGRLHATVALALALAALASACGRLAFDSTRELDASGAIDDGAPDTQTCGPLDQFADDFGAPGTAWWWTPEINPPVTIAENSGLMTVGLAPNAIGYGRYDSTCRYDLVGSKVDVRLATPPTVAGGIEALLAIYIDANNTAFITIDNGLVQAAKRVGGVYTGLGNATYSAPLHRFLRIRATATTLFWETSSDRSAWTALDSDALPFPVSSVFIEISAGVYQAHPSPGVAQFDDFNLP